MSCEIKVISNISEIDKVRRYLYPTDDLRGIFMCNKYFQVSLFIFVGSDSWFRNCKVSVCPTGDVIAIIRQTRLVVLTSKWDFNSSTTQYQISFCGIPQENDAITAILCLPVVGQTQNSDVCRRKFDLYVYLVIIC